MGLLLSYNTSTELRRRRGKSRLLRLGVCYFPVSSTHLNASAPRHPVTGYLSLPEDVQVVDRTSTAHCITVGATTRALGPSCSLWFISLLPLLKRKITLEKASWLQRQQHFVQTVFRHLPATPRVHGACLVHCPGTVGTGTTEP